MRRLVVISLIGVTVGCLGWITVGRLGRPQPPTEAMTATAPTAAPADVSIADALSMSVFGAARAPVAPVTVTTAQISGSELKLSGIVFTPRRRAALVARPGASAIWLRPGETQYGITLTKLESAAAELQVGGMTTRLELFKAAPVAPQATSGQGGAQMTSPVARGREPASAPPGALPLPGQVP